MSPRPLVVVLGCALATTPAACGTFSGDGSSTTDNASDSTVFRTITVEIATSSTTLPATAGGTGAATQSTLDANIYEVQDGDSWYKIANTLKVKVDALLAVNNASLDTVLLKGQRLAIPKPGDSGANGIAPPAPGNATGTDATGQATPTLAPGSAATSYQIQPGDSWSKIASKLNIPMSVLLAANDATTKTVLLAGKYIKVPKT
jgi:LysM repeat protein